MKIEKQYPLTSIINIVYDENDNPIVFKLEFQKIEVILEAHDPTKCKQWVEAIKKGTYNIAIRITMQSSCLSTVAIL